MTLLLVIDDGTNVMMVSDGSVPMLMVMVMVMMVMMVMMVLLMVTI
jgi:hypothetical protein